MFVALGIQGPQGEYPSRHSLHAGSLAMAIGATLGYDTNTLLELGIGCLVHDVGMLSLHRDAYESNRILSADEFREVAKHPLLTFELLNQHMSWLPPTSRMVAYQIHERCDGSGYPRGRSANQIHELARVAAVADVFVALLSPRPHRPAMIPYRAMERIVYDTKKGYYDPEVVRAAAQNSIALSAGILGRIERRTHRPSDAGPGRPVESAGRAGVQPAASG